MPRKIVCKICGKESIEDYLCEEHFLEKSRLFDVAPVSVKLCERCGRVNERTAGKWVRKASIEQAVEDVIHENVSENGQMESFDIKLMPVGKNFLAEIEASGYIAPAEVMKNETRTLMVSISKLKCPDCVKVLGSYYEAIVQLRGANAERILAQIEKLAEGKLFSLERIKEGYNLRFLSKRDASRVAGALKRDYKIIHTSKLVGQKKDKRLFRDVYAVR